MKIYCDDCEGTGKVLNTQSYEHEKCKSCKGEGYFDLEKCIEVVKAINWAEENYTCRSDYGEICFYNVSEIVEKHKEFLIKRSGE